MLKNVHKLKLSPSVKIDKNKEGKIDSKRMQRQIKRQLENKGIGAKAQQALKLQLEQSKNERKIKRRLQKDFEKEQKFVLRQDKKKAKHKGR
ncbi:hypothetical protein N3C_0297 [Clostridium sp. N3C]|nr:hypothetical protein N3C_0297 [Clostridium sp. N3C]